MKITMKIALTSAFLIAFLLLSGCSGSVPEIWVDQNDDFHTTIVEGILLPAYLNSDASQAAKNNVASAVAEHRAAIESWQGN